MNPDFVFLTAGAFMAITVLALTAEIIGWISPSTTYGLLAIGQAVMCVGGFVTENTVAASISGAATGYLAWQWWNGGGGDNTRRRLRRWGRRFQGVRRTAPAGTS